jgi:hypothetical protein
MMLMTTYHQQKKGHGGELCLSIHQGGTQVQETWPRDASGLATNVWVTGYVKDGMKAMAGRQELARQYNGTS